jgi:CubicO group peptidase (beta-lactamase class C family)
MVDSLVRAIPEGWNGTTTDPQALGIMVGSPPPPDKQVRFADFSFMAYPNMRWSLNHRRELCPTVAVTRGTGPVRPLPVSADAGIGELNLTSLDGAQMTVEDALDATFADGFLVLQHGAIVYEKYFGAGAPDRPHMAFSITKSLTQELFAEMTRQTGMRQHLTGWSYRNMFFHPNDADGAFAGRGIFGQTLYVNPRADIVIARYSSSPVAANNDEDAITVPMIDAIVAHLGARPA